MARRKTCSCNRRNSFLRKTLKMLGGYIYTKSSSVKNKSIKKGSMKSKKTTSVKKTV